MCFKLSCIFTLEWISSDDSNEVTYITPEPDRESLTSSLDCPRDKVACPQWRNTTTAFCVVTRGLQMVMICEPWSSLLQQQSPAQHISLYSESPTLEHRTTGSVYLAKTFYVHGLLTSTRTNSNYIYHLTFQLQRKLINFSSKNKQQLINFPRCRNWHWLHRYNLFCWR